MNASGVAFGVYDPLAPGPLDTTGGVQVPESNTSWDHLVWVTVDDEGAHIANLKMSGILDKTGEVPLGGAEL